MENRPPGKTQEELDAIAAFEMESWAEYRAETGVRVWQPTVLVGARRGARLDAGALLRLLGCG